MVVLRYEIALVASSPSFSSFAYELIGSLDFIRKATTLASSKKGIFSSKWRKLSFCSLLATEFHTLSLSNGPKISSLNFSRLKIQVGLLK